MNKEFKSRLNGALGILRKEMNLMKPKSQRLFTPIFENRSYRWAIAMDSDGILAAERRIAEGEANEPKNKQILCVGVLIQSEYTTSNTKPNPFGKAAVGQVPFGVWFDTEDGNRVRFDRAHILFVLPKFVAPKYKKGFETVRRNVENAAAAMPDVEVLVLERRWGRKEVAKRLKKHVRKWLKGVGRPNSSN
jgi:hypothetical protein